MRVPVAHGSGMLGPVLTLLTRRSVFLRGRNPDLPCCPKCAGCRLLPSNGEVADVGEVMRSAHKGVTPETACVFAASADMAKGAQIRFGKKNGRTVYWRDGELVDPSAKIQQIKESCGCR